MPIASGQVITNNGQFELVTNTAVGLSIEAQGPYWCRFLIQTPPHWTNHQLLSVQVTEAGSSGNKRGYSAHLNTNTSFYVYGWQFDGMTTQDNTNDHKHEDTVGGAYTGLQVAGNDAAPEDGPQVYHAHNINPPFNATTLQFHVTVFGRPA